MPGRTGCCRYNLVKIDPTTGAIIWRRLIRGDRTDPLPIIGKVEPVRGTNDVVVACSSGTKTGTHKYSNIVYVTEFGDEAWYYNGGMYNPKPQALHAVRFATHEFGSASGVIAFLTENFLPGPRQIVMALDYAGNIAWQSTGPATYGGGGTSSVEQLRISPTHIVNVFDTVRGQPYIRTMNTLTGSTIFYTQTGTAALILRTIDQSNGFYDISRDLGSGLPSEGIYKLTSTGVGIFPGSETVGPAESGHPFRLLARFQTGAPIISDCADLAGGANYLLDVNYSISGVPGLTLRWTQTQVIPGGVGPLFQPVWCTDTDSDPSGVYFCGMRSVARTPVVDLCTVYKRESLYGNLLWVQDFDFTNGVNPTPTCGGVCVADDGYVYACGQPL